VPFFVLKCLDAAGSAETRAKRRDEHLEHVRGSGKVRIAGPLLDGADAVCGSLLIVEAANLADAQAFSNADPYREAGVWSAVEIMPFRMTFVNVTETANAAGKS
jgi:uncharacterized protein YciI